MATQLAQSSSPPPCTAMRCACTHALPLTIIVKSQKNQMSIWTKSDPSQRPPASRLCYSDWFLNQTCVQELTGMERKLERAGTSSRKYLHHYRPTFTALVPRSIYKGVFFHLRRLLLASYNIQRNLKDNSWHLMPTCQCFPSDDDDLFTQSITYTLHNCPTGAIQASLGRDKLDRESCISETFHFVILEFTVIDGRASQSSLMLSQLGVSIEEYNA